MDRWNGKWAVKPGTLNLVGVNRPQHPNTIERISEKEQDGETTTQDTYTRKGGG